MARTRLEEAGSQALEFLGELTSAGLEPCPIETDLRAALDALAETRSYTKHEIYVMAAGLETPDDLTPEEQEENASDIVDFLLMKAEQLG